MESIEEMIDRMTLERRLLTELIEEGTPEAISNFTAKCEYCRHKADHKTERLIRIENTQGEKTTLLPLPALSNGRLAEFRVWCLECTQGVAVWRGGEKDLQNLTEDMKHLSHTAIYSKSLITDSIPTRKLPSSETAHGRRTARYFSPTTTISSGMAAWAIRSMWTPHS